MLRLSRRRDEGRSGVPRGVVARLPPISNPTQNASKQLKSGKNCTLDCYFRVFVGVFCVVPERMGAFGTCTRGGAAKADSMWPVQQLPYSAMKCFRRKWFFDKLCSFELLRGPADECLAIARHEKNFHVRSRDSGFRAPVPGPSRLPRKIAKLAGLRTTRNSRLCSCRGVCWLRLFDEFNRLNNLIVNSH